MWDVPVRRVYDMVWYAGTFCRQTSLWRRGGDDAPSARYQSVCWTNTEATDQDTQFHLDTPGQCVYVFTMILSIKRGYPFSLSCVETACRDMLQWWRHKLRCALQARLGFDSKLLCRWCANPYLSGEVERGQWHDVLQFELYRSFLLLLLLFCFLSFRIFFWSYSSLLFFLSLLFFFSSLVLQLI